MKFGAHFLPTYVPELDGPITQFYRRMFEQIESLERLGFDRAWVTEHHFGDYGGSFRDPLPFFVVLVVQTSRLPFGVGGGLLPLNNTLYLADIYGMVVVLLYGWPDFCIRRG